MGGGGGGYYCPTTERVDTHEEQCLRELDSIHKWAGYTQTSVDVFSDLSIDREAIAADFKEVVVHMARLDECFGNWERQQKRRG